MHFSHPTALLLLSAAGYSGAAAGIGNAVGRGREPRLHAGGAAVACSAAAPGSLRPAVPCGSRCAVSCLCGRRLHVPSWLWCIAIAAAVATNSLLHNVPLALPAGWRRSSWGCFPWLESCRRPGHKWKRPGSALLPCSVTALPMEMGLSLRSSSRSRQPSVTQHLRHGKQPADQAPAARQLCRACCSLLQHSWRQ